MLTDKGRVYVALAAVRDRWDQFTPDQRAEVAELVQRLNAAMRREEMSLRIDNRPANGASPAPARVPLLGRLTA